MKNLYVISGVGILSGSEDWNFFKNNTNSWIIFEDILNDDKLSEIQKYCIKIIATHICLSELWQNWGIKPDIIIGHSFGEISSCFISGVYNIFDTIELALKIAEEVEKEKGWLCHGYDLKLVENTYYSSINFKNNNKVHLTVCGLDDSLDIFLKENQEAKKMYLENPWHHKIYENKKIKIRKVNESKIDLFLSSKGSKISNLNENHWNDWLCNKSNMIDTIAQVQELYPNETFNIIELGAHPVMEQMVSNLSINTYVSSMNRSMDIFYYILEMRKKILDSKFIDLIKEKCKKYDTKILFDEPLLFQNYNSLKLTELSNILGIYFPNIGPQDLYNFATINKLIENYGKSQEIIYSPKKLNYDDEDPIVIIGASCILPYDIYSLNDLWDKLLNGFDGIRILKDLDNLPCGFIDDLIFDNNKFKISKKEAESMDPQQILALILSDLLFQDSGLKKEDLWGTKTGVYIGCWNLDYEGNKSSAYYAIGKNPSIISARISSHYNLLGPSKVINTACASSLECVYDAYKDIKLGNIDFAIAGGVNMLGSKDFTHAMKKSSFLGDSGRCKSFDNSADGYVRSEGGGLVLIARKSKVTSYYAEIIGGSTNHNGYSPLITVPSSEAQKRLIIDSCKDANISSNEIDYIECHGTGTKIGDPLEIAGLKDIIDSKRKNPCYLGSIKSNIGHLESGAGIAGLIKSILILKKQLIPRNIHIKELNKNLNLHNGMKVVTEHIESNINIIGVSSFGFGGSNGHILLKKSDNNKEIPDIELNKNGILIKRNNSIKDSNLTKTNKIKKSKIKKSKKNKIKKRKTNKIKKKKIY